MRNYSHNFRILKKIKDVCVYQCLLNEADFIYFFRRDSWDLGPNGLNNRSWTEVKNYS